MDTAALISTKHTDFNHYTLSHPLVPCEVTTQAHDAASSDHKLAKH